MKGLKKAAGETKRSQRNGYGHSFQINYDPETKEIWTDEFVSSRSFVPYPGDIISFKTSVPMTMQEIEKIINDVIAEREKEEQYENLEMKGLNKAAEDTKRCLHGGYGHSFQINYDPETKEIWTNEFTSSGSYIPYSGDIISFNTSVTMTKREIEKRINDEIAEREKQKSDRRFESEEPEL